MNIVDIALILILLLGAFTGYRKGFLSELFSVLAIILGILAGFKLMGAAMLLLMNNYSIDEKILPYVAFGIVFLVVVIVVSMLGNFFKASLEKTVLGNVDQVAGAMLGIFKTAFMISVAIWLTTSMEFEIPPHLSEDSWLYPITASIAPTVTSWVAEIFPIFRDLFGGHS